MKYSKSLIVVISSLLFASILFYNIDTKTDSNVDLGDNENSINIAVTYEVLDEGMQVWPNPVSEEKVKALIEFTESEINQYCQENGLEIRFNLVPKGVLNKGGISEGEFPWGLEETMWLHEQGIDLIVGHDFSKASHYSLEYADENSMVLLSPSGVGLGMSYPGDSLFRLMPNDNEDPDVYARVLSELMKKMGYDAFVSIGYPDQYVRLGLDAMGEDMNYSYTDYEVIVDPNVNDILPYLEDAVSSINHTKMKYGSDRVCIISPFSESWIRQAENIEELRTVRWFEYWPIPELIVEKELCSLYANLGFTSLIRYPADTPKADQFQRDYIEHVGELPTPSKMYGEAARYDACWIMALSVIEANSTDSIKIKETIPLICATYEGVLGNCSLNVYGDREKTDFRIYEWIMMDGKAEYVNIGYYNSTHNSFKIFPR